MGQGKPCRPSAGKLRRVGIWLGLAAFLASSSFFAPVFLYCHLLTYLTSATCNVSGFGPPSLVISAEEPLSPGEDDSCTLWDVASNFDYALLQEQAALESSSPAISFSCDHPIPHISRFKWLISTPRSPPSHFNSA